MLKAANEKLGWVALVCGVSVTLAHHESLSKPFSLYIRRVRTWRAATLRRQQCMRWRTRCTDRSWRRSCSASSTAVPLSPAPWSWSTLAAASRPRAAWRARRRTWCVQPIQYTCLLLFIAWFCSILYSSMIEVASVCRLVLRALPSITLQRANEC